MSQALRDDDGLTATERTALVVLAIARGRQMNTRQIANLAQCTPSGARRLLGRASRVVPLYQDAGGVWCLDRGY